MVNGKYLTSFEVILGKFFAKKKNKIQFCSSDAHSIKSVGSAYTTFNSIVELPITFDSVYFNNFIKLNNSSIKLNWKFVSIIKRIIRRVNKK